MSYAYVRATIDGGFWQTYHALLRREVLTHQWKALNDRIAGAPPSHSVENFKIAAGMGNGEYQGMVFQDSDLAKWLQAAAHALKETSR